MDESSVLPIILAAAVTAGAFALARRFVKNPNTSKPFQPVLDDLGALLIGAVGMVEVAIHQAEAGVWSWFIDLASFTVAASLVATSRPTSWPRRLGLVILGVHGAQVIATNSNAPLRSLIGHPEVASSTTEVAAAAVNYMPILIAIATVAIVATIARFVVPNPPTKKRFVPEQADLIPLAAGFVGMAVGGLFQDGASVWNLYVDVGAISIGASLMATGQPSTWPRRVGLLMIGLHLAQVIVTDIDAPLYAALSDFRAEQGFSGDDLDRFT